MEECIFCKIAKNEANCYCVYEDDNVKAFLDINPWTKGHTLAIPKKHYKDIFDIPEKDFEEIMRIVRKIALVYKKILGCDINIIQSSGKNAQQDFFHFHVHIIPRYVSDGQKIELKVNKSLRVRLLSTLNKIKEVSKNVKNIR